VLVAGRLDMRRSRLPALAAAVALGALGAWCQSVTAWQAKPPRAAPGPLAIRQRTTKLLNKQTGMPRPLPAKVDEALDYFQRTFPDVSTEEHLLIERWEDISAIFGGGDYANELVMEEPSILRWPKPGPRRSYHYLEMYLGEKAARKVVFEQPYLLTKKAGQLRRTLPALLNLYGSKKKLAEICVKYPQLMQAPVADFYKGMPNMIAVAGNPEKALEVAAEAMDAVASRKSRSTVPEPWPAIVAIFGGLAEATAAIEREPLLLKYQGEQFLGKLATLRMLLGREGAQEAVRKAPFLLLHEDQRKSQKFKLSFLAMERYFGAEGARKRVLERPELLALGVTLERALDFAERKYGSRQAVADDFENVLKRTGLSEHLGWEAKSRPRRGLWTPSQTQYPTGFPPNSNSWSPHKNPTGRAGPARGRWDEEVSDEDGGDADKSSQWMLEAAT